MCIAVRWVRTERGGGGDWQMSFFLANGSAADARQMLEGMGIESRALVLFAVRPSV